MGQAWLDVRAHLGEVVLHLEQRPQGCLQPRRRVAQRLSLLLDARAQLFRGRAPSSSIDAS